MNHTHSIPSWHFVQETELYEASNAIRLSETDGAADFCWSCNHCSEYVNDYPFGATRATVVAHVTYA